MGIRYREAIAATLLFLVPAVGMAADISFAYQGCLLDDKGMLLSNRNHVVEFRIYDTASGGTALWGCTRSVLLDERGLFSVELSGNSPSGGSLGDVFSANAARTLYIGLTVDSDAAEIEPRQKILSVPKAFCAADSVAARGDLAVSSNLVVSAAADTGATSANSLTVANGMECDGKLMSGTMSVCGDVSVEGAIAGNGVIPIGGIVVWRGASTDIPDGWALCDGLTYNGRKTPDLSNRFILGVSGKYKVGNQGGAETVKLTVSQMPSHRHEYKFKGADFVLAWSDDNIFYDSTDHYPKHGNPRYTESEGGAKAHENRPPYWALCYIMRVK